MRVSVQRISPLRRWLAIPMVVLSLLAGIGPFADEGSFTSPLFGPIRDIAPLKVWGAVWLVACTFALVAVIKASWHHYIAAHVLVAGLSMLWLGTLVNARWWQHIDLSFTAIGLWGYPLGHSLVSLLVHAHVWEDPPDVCRHH